MKPSQKGQPHRITRRAVLGGAAAALPAWAFAVGPAGAILRVAVEEDHEWQPRLFTEDQARAVGLLAETILPSTETPAPGSSASRSPGALDARVHEFIDLELSLGDAEDRDEFLDGLAWLEARSQRLFGRAISALADYDRVALLEPISDSPISSSPISDSQSDSGSDSQSDHDSGGGPDLATGVAFFADLKRRTVFAFFTSEVGRVEELGLSDVVTMEKLRGCTHRDGHRA